MPLAVMSAGLRCAGVCLQLCGGMVFWIACTLLATKVDQLLIDLDIQAWTTLESVHAKDSAMFGCSFFSACVTVLLPLLLEALNAALKFSEPVQL